MPSVMEAHLPFSSRPKSELAGTDRRSPRPASFLSSAWSDCVTDQPLARIAKNRASKLLKTGIVLNDQTLANGRRGLAPRRGRSRETGWLRPVAKDTLRNAVGKRLHFNGKRTVSMSSEDKVHLLSSVISTVISARNRARTVNLFAPRSPLEKNREIPTNELLQTEIIPHDQPLAKTSNATFRGPA